MKKILIVDDNTNLANIIEFKLIEEGFEVITAYNGQDGLEKANIHKPDIIITDIMMPRSTGLEMEEKLKKSDLTKDIPIIFLTSSFEDNIIGRNKLLEKHCVLEKAVDMNVLLSKVKQILHI